MGAGDSAPHRDCLACVQANREYARRHARGAVTPKVVTDSEYGDVVAAVQRELDSLPAALSMPGVAAAALSMAAILDDPLAAGKPAAAGQLRALLMQVREEKVGTSGTLAELKRRRGG